METARDRAKKQSHNYRRKHYQKVLESNARRKAILAGVTVEKVDRERVYQQDNGMCYICGKPVAPDNWHLEHVIPISKGGPHSYNNVRVSCATCNIKKRDKILDIGAK